MLPVYVFIICVLHFCSECCYAVDTLTSAQILKDPEALVSNNKVFRLGFFSPSNSTNRYVGIWYNQPSIMEVIWVANKNSPLTDSSGILKLSSDGNLQVSNSKNVTLWSSNVTNPQARFSVAQTLDSGHLAVEGFKSNRSLVNGTAIWQSFQYPTDSVLPNMRFLLTKNSDLRNVPDDECDHYGKCGEFGSCNPRSSPMCSCLKGFEPKDKEEWKRGNWTSGCLRRKPRQCGPQGNSEGFLRLQTMKVPDNAEWTGGLNREQCRDNCAGNCSCLAYAYDTEIVCMTWSTKLIDIANLAPGGADLYIRLAHSELGNNNNRLKAIIIPSVVGGLIVLAVVIWFLWKQLPKRNTRFGNQQGRYKSTPDPRVFVDKSQRLADDMQIMKFDDLVQATNNFNEINLLGRGGFGQVYKGTLEDGQVIAVKRLSRLSGQGIEEFMNEVEVISKLQHHNLVKLLGCCVDGDEKMLIYEHMSNKSLDAYLFDPQKRAILHWKKRFSIIEGICRGLLYLHRDSRLKIIHRDLKPSNILLDENLNPKISDFGMARIFGGNQDHCSTQRVAGTYGYMSPEYAMEGHFSEKSDVFSFGVLLMEIICGKRNSSFWFQEESLSLLGYTWKLWNEDNIIVLIDPSICSPDIQGEIIKCIKIGLLCVQELAKDRPNISTVISMLGSDITDLPKPKPPGFIQRQTANDQGSSFLSTEKTSSLNEVTVTSVSPR